MLKGGVVWIIAIGKKNGKIVSYRLLEGRNKNVGESSIFYIASIQDISTDVLKKLMKQGRICPINAQLEEDKIVGTRGCFEKYTHFDVLTHKLISESVVILGYNDLGEYACVYPSSNINNIELIWLNKEDLYKAKFKLSNASRRKSRHGLGEISGTRFTFDLIERKTA